VGRILLPLMLVAGLPLSSAAAAPAPAPPDSRALGSYDFDPARPLADRAVRMPDWLLGAWRSADDAPQYHPHALTPAERREFAAALDGLPPRLQDALRERLIAFYFISNLKGNGVTSWVLDASSRTYVYMILNPAGFHQTLSELLTQRERSPFRGAVDVSIDVGEGGSGILYTVAHECAHAFDFTRGLTPYTDPDLLPRLGREPTGDWDVWKTYATPRPEDDFPARAKLHFYGFGAPEIAAADAPSACADLARSPFVSFYGARSWAEDAAELFVAYHLTRDLGRPYREHCAGRTREPMSDARVRARAEKILGPMLAGPAANP
jgi:hypothetical protein